MVLSNALSQREYIQIGVQNAHSLDSNYVAIPDDELITIPVNPGTGRYEGGKLQLLDEGRRGVNATAFGAQEGVGQGTINIEANIRVAESNADQMAMYGYLAANVLETDDYTPVAGSSNGTQNGVAIDRRMAKLHTLTPGTTKRFLTIKHGVTDSYEFTFLDAICTTLTTRFTIAQGFATFAATLMSQDRVATPARSPADVNVPSGLQIPGWVCLADIPSGDDQNSRRGFGLARADVDLPEDINRDIMMMEWTIQRGEERHYGAIANQKMSDIFFGPLNATCSMNLLFSEAGIAKLYTEKIQARLAANATADPFEDARTAGDGLGIKLEFPNADFANEMLREDLSNIHAHLPLAAIGLVEQGKQTAFPFTAANRAVVGQIAVQVVQHQPGNAKFTEGAPQNGLVNANVPVAQLSALTLALTSGGSSQAFTPPFMAGTFNYARAIANTVNSVFIGGTAPVGSTVTINGASVTVSNTGAIMETEVATMASGTHTITVVVRLGGRTSTYTITVTKA